MHELTPIASPEKELRRGSTVLYRHKGGLHDWRETTIQKRGTTGVFTTDAVDKLLTYQHYEFAWNKTAATVPDETPSDESRTGATLPVVALPQDEEPAINIGDILKQMPSELADCTVAITHFLREERLCGMRACILVSHVRAKFWPARNQSNEFIAWGMESLGVDKSTVFKYLTAGDVLLRPSVRNQSGEVQQKLLHCHWSKLLVLNKLSEKQLYHWLKDHDPSSCSRTELEQQIDAELDRIAGKQLPEGNPKAEAVERLEAFCVEAKRLATTGGAKAEIVLQHANHGKLLVGGISLAMMALRAEKAKRDVKNEDLKDALTYIAKLHEDIQALIAGV